MRAIFNYLRQEAIPDPIVPDLDVFDAFLLHCKEKAHLQNFRDLLPKLFRLLTFPKFTVNDSVFVQLEGQCFTELQCLFGFAASSTYISFVADEGQLETVESTPVALSDSFLSFRLPERRTASSF